MVLAILLTGHLIGLTTAIVVIMQGTHRARGAVAWVLGLIGVPWIAVPLYWLSGHVRYEDYAAAMAAIDSELDAVLAGNQPLEAVASHAEESAEPNQSRVDGEARALNRFGILPTSSSNDVEIYRSGADAFTAIESAINGAEDAVLLQTYLLRDDVIGRRIADALVAACVRGCNVFLLYDELGSRGLDSDFFRALENAGGQVRAFSLTRRLLPRLRMNFRNHRKLLVIDGRRAFLGGLNIGDEYIDGGDAFVAWRDTHMQLNGPCVLALQRVFVEDWHFASNDQGSPRLVHELTWDPAATDKTKPGQSITICGLGPHLQMLSGDELFTFLIGAAVTRLHIATPYFVPDDRVITSLKAAALRGVDVTVLVPRALDHGIFARVHEAFAEELLAYGVKVFFYENGFMHQKVLLVDDKYAVIGSANFDNRSFRLNFELVAIISAGTAIADVAAMLQEDLDCATLFEPVTSDKPWYDSLLTNTYRLMAPVL